MASVIRLFVAVLATQASIGVIALSARGQVSRAWGGVLLAVAVGVLLVELRSLHKGQPEEEDGWP